MVKNLQESAEFFAQMADELNTLAEFDQMEMYRALTGKGKEIPPLFDGEATDENFVKGCVSQVYVAASAKDGTIEFRGSADSHVISGYLAILITGLSGLSPADVIEGARPIVQHFADTTNIRAALTPNRANAFGNIFELMVSHARAVSGV